MSASVRPGTSPGVRTEPRRSMAVCALIGAAVTAAVDEIVFHQILGWHHFYDRATTSAGLLSDGLLHTAELLAQCAGFFLSPICAAVDPWRRAPPGRDSPSAWAPSSCSTASWTTSCCACTRSATQWTSPPTTWPGTSPVCSCCSPAPGSPCARRGGTVTADRRRDTRACPPGPRRGTGTGRGAHRRGRAAGDRRLPGGSGAAAAARGRLAPRPGRLVRRSRRGNGLGDAGRTVGRAVHPARGAAPGRRHGGPAAVHRGTPPHPRPARAHARPDPATPHDPRALRARGAAALSSRGCRLGHRRALPPVPHATVRRHSAPAAVARRGTRAHGGGRAAVHLRRVRARSGAPPLGPRRARHDRTDRRYRPRRAGPHALLPAAAR